MKWAGDLAMCLGGGMGVGVGGGGKAREGGHKEAMKATTRGS